MIRAKVTLSHADIGQLDPAVTGKVDICKVKPSLFIGVIYIANYK